MGARLRFTATVVLPLAVVTATYVAIREYSAAPDDTAARDGHGYIAGTLGREDTESQEGPDTRAGESPTLPSTGTPHNTPTESRPPDGVPAAPPQGVPPFGLTNGDTGTVAPPVTPTRAATPQPSPTTSPTGRPTASPTTPEEPTPTPTRRTATRTPQPPSPTVSPPDSPTKPPRPSPTTRVPDLTRAERGLIDASNRVRRQSGCADLRVDASLTAAARMHSADMRERRFYSHVNPNGDGPADRGRAAGFEGRVSEQIARGLLGGPRSVVNGWLRRGDGRAQITDCEYTAVGVGVESGVLGQWWTQMLGTD